MSRSFLYSIEGFRLARVAVLLESRVRSAWISFPGSMANTPGIYLSFAKSLLACRNLGMLGSDSSQSLKKS
jgi:hypothetical protein